MTHEADILIVTVTKVETSAAIAAFKEANGFKEQGEWIGNRPYYNLGQVGSARVFLTQSEMGSSGLDGSLLTVRKGIEALSPLAVIMVGIAFGRDENTQTIGDILVAKQLRPYDLRKIGQDGTIFWRGDKAPASTMLLSLFRTAEQNWNVSNTSKVHFGTVLSGETLIDNKEYRDLLFDGEPEADGGEMEGTGLYTACHDQKVDWILVKGICDWADGNKSQDKKSRQKMAASNAAAFVVSALKFFPIEWSQQRNGSHIEKASSNLSFYLFERLQSLNSTDYQLLCRLGCYRHKDITSLNKESISFLLWDMPQKVNRMKIIDSLCQRLLIEFKNNEYSIHSAVYWEAKRRLESNKEEWKNANIQIAESYSREVTDVASIAQVKTAHKAINHYYDADNFEKCYEMLLNILEAKENLSNLRCSDNLWRHDSMIIEVCEQLIESNGLKRSDKALTYIPLGVLYPEIGKNNKAIEVSKDIIHIVKPLNKKTRLAQVSAYLISARANKNIGNFLQAKADCKEAEELAKYTKSDAKKLKAFALYELGTVCLEIAKIDEVFSRETSHQAREALDLIGNAALQYVGIILTELPMIFHGFFTRLIATQVKTEESKFEEENEDFEGIEEIIKKYQNRSKENGSAKIFRILHSFGKCLRLMNRNRAGRWFLESARNSLNDTDDLNNAWSYLELALCSSTSIEAEDNYNKARKNYPDLPTLCQAHILLEYGKFMCKQGDYTAAIEQHQELEKLLEETELESLKAINYYSICQAYLAIKNSGEITSNDNFSFYLQESSKIIKELNLNYSDRIQELHVAFNS
jgi:nucleoside phosphorylase